MSAETLEIGYVAGAHGVRGAVWLTLHDTSSQTLQPGLELAFHRDGSVVTADRVESLSDVPGQPGRFRVGLNGVRDRDAAEALKGCTIHIARDALPPLAPDEFYLADLVGLSVERERGGQSQVLGRVIRLATNGAQDLLEIEWTNARGRVDTWFLPVLPGFVLDVNDDHIIVDAPLGMLPDEFESSSS